MVGLYRTQRLLQNERSHVACSRMDSLQGRRRKGQRSERGVVVARSLGPTKPMSVAVVTGGRIPRVIYKT